MAAARRPILYVGGGVINSGPQASVRARRIGARDRLSDHAHPDGARRLSGSDPQFLGMLGMHGTLEANLAMHGCDLMIAIGSRFDDRVTGRLDSFSPGSTKIHVDIDPSSINKNVPVDLPIVADAGRAIVALLGRWRARKRSPGPPRASPGGTRSPPGGRRIRCAIARTARSSSRNSDPAAARPDHGPRDLHHHRGRPAPDVGGAALSPWSSRATG